MEDDSAEEMTTTSFLDVVIKKTKLTSKKKDKKTKKLAKAAQKNIPEDIVPGTVYVGHLPHGFYEDQLQKYFSQFGKITRMRLARSRRTGGCKGYAFIEFETEEVAKIVADTMNNYMFFEKLLKCEFIAHDKLHLDTFRGWNKHLPLGCEVNRKKHNSEKTAEQLKLSNIKRAVNVEKLKSVLQSKGIDFKFKLPGSSTCKK